MWIAVVAVCILYVLHLIGAASLGNVREGQHVIYVDAQHGTSDHTCWNGGKEHPCNSLDSAMEGAQQTNSSVTVINLQQGQCPAPATDNYLCSDKLENGESGSTEAFLMVENATSCPTWYIPQQVNNSVECICGGSAGGAVVCNPKSEEVFLWHLFCMTYYDNSGQSLVVGPCPYTAHNSLKLLPQNASQLEKFICEFTNRQGQLCGQCKEGFFSSVYDLHCKNCSITTGYIWAQYFLSTFGPVTIFFIFVIIFRISATSASLNAFILVSQIHSAPICLRLAFVKYPTYNTATKTLFQAYGILYGFWNLDFFRLVLPPVCLPLTSLQLLALEYVVAIYPLLLIVLTCTLIELHAHNFRPIVCLWKPFHKCLVLIRRQ